MFVETIKNHDGKVIVKINRNLTDREAAEDFKEAVEKVLDEGEKEIVLNLKGVDMINSYGIGKIIMFYKRLQKLGGKLYLMEPMPPDVRETLDLLRLTQVLETYGN